MTSRTSFKISDILSDKLHKKLVIKEPVQKLNKLQLRLDNNIVSHIKQMIYHIESYVDMFTPSSNIDPMEKHFLRKFKYYNTAWKDLCNQLINIFEPIDSVTNFSLCMDVKKELLNKLYNIVLALFMFDPELEDGTGLNICTKINNWIGAMKVTSVKIIHGFSAIDSLNIIHTITQKKLNKVISMRHKDNNYEQITTYKTNINHLIFSKEEIIDSIRNIISNTNKFIDFDYFMSYHLSCEMNNYFEIYYQ